MNNLYMINIGGETKNSNIEVHDILFICAQSIEDTYETIRKSWYGTKESLHIDSYLTLKEIDGYNIELSDLDSNDKLYMIIYGGHFENKFSESHKIQFVVAQSKSEAKIIGNSQLMNFKPMDHIDSICDVQAVLLGEKKMIKLNKSSSKFDETPDWHGYIKL